MATCIIVNCRRETKSNEALCSVHRKAGKPVSAKKLIEAAEKLEPSAAVNPEGRTTWA